MIKLVSNQLEGHFAAPKNHPVTCANPMPWLIDEVKIEYRSFDNVVLWIRNKESMWFRADHCVIGVKHELQEWLDYQECIKRSQTV